MIQHQILRTSIIRVVGQTVRRITNEILDTKGLRKQKLLKKPRTLTALFTISNADVPTKCIAKT